MLVNSQSGHWQVAFCQCRSAPRSAMTFVNVRRSWSRPKCCFSPGHYSKEVFHCSRSKIRVERRRVPSPVLQRLLPMQKMLTGIKAPTKRRGTIDALLRSPMAGS